MERTTGIATRLADHPTSAISDALDDLGIAGAFSGIRAMREGIGRVGGRALPVRFVRKANDPDVVDAFLVIQDEFQRIAARFADSAFAAFA